MQLYNISCETLGSSLRVKSRAVCEKHFFPVGLCLRRKISDRDYTGFSQNCPVCSAPPWHKCLGASGAVSPICHVERELRSAESYRAKIRQRIVRRQVATPGSVRP